MENEIDIIEKAANGDKDAWVYIHKKYEKALLSFIKYHYSPHADMDAEDILQGTWENIIKKEKLKEFNPRRSSLYKYLLYITKYEILHYFDRKNKKFRIHGQDYRLVLINETDYYSNDHTNEDKSIEEQLSILFYNHLVEQNVIDTDDLYTLLEIFPRGGPPHQILAFGFNRLISHWRKQPKKISDELSREFLKNLTDIFINDFLTEIHRYMPEEPMEVLKDLCIKDYFRPLEECMDKIVGDVLSERDNKARYHIHLMKKTGTTLLLDYYTSKPEKHISDWSDKVMKRLKKLWQEIKEK